MYDVMGYYTNMVGGGDSSEQDFKMLSKTTNGSTRLKYQNNKDLEFFRHNEPVMTLNQDGNLFIGTSDSNPKLNEKLNVEGNVMTNNGYMVGIENDLLFGNNNLNVSTDFALKQTGDGDTILNSKKMHSVFISHGDKKKYAFTPLGMGIGTSDPEDTLHVKGNALMTGNLTVGGELKNEKLLTNISTLQNQINDLNKKLQNRTQSPSITHLNRLEKKVDSIDLKDCKKQINNLTNDIIKLQQRMDNYEKSLRFMNNKINRQLEQFISMNSKK